MARINHKEDIQQQMVEREELRIQAQQEYEQEKSQVQNVIT